MADLNIQLILRLVDRATAPARAALRAIERVGGEGLMRQAQQVAAGTRMMGSGLADVRAAALKGTAVMAGYGASVVGLSGLFLGPAAEMERFRVQLTNLEGSAEGAKAAMDWIMDFAQRTPLELNQTVAAYAKLRAFGIDPTNGSLQALVDTMAASGRGAEQLDGLVLALGQAWTKGKLQGEEALQLLERGVPVWDLLGEKLGKNAAQLQEMASKGKLGREELTLLMEAMAERYAGASDGMSKTWDGILSKMTDFWYSFRVMTMDAGVFDALKARLNQTFDYLDAMSKDGRLQAWADLLAQHMLAVLGALWRFGAMAVDAWRQLWPHVAAVADLLGGWDRLGWIVAAILMRGTLIQLALGFGGIALGAARAGWGILSMLMPLNIVRTAALLWMATGLGAALAAVAVAGIWIWRNWSGLGVFFAELWTSFREALGPALPALDGIIAHLASVRDWVLSITGPLNESGESWRRLGRSAGTALADVARGVGDWASAYPRTARALGYLAAALGLIRLLMTPVSAGLGLISAAAGALGTAVGMAVRLLIGFRAALLVVARAGLWLAGGTLKSLAFGFRLVGQAVLFMGRAALANPIIALIAAIAGAAYVIYDNWDNFSSYFLDKIDRVRAAFDDGLLNGALAILAEFNPFVLMMDAAEGFFAYVTGWTFGDVTSALKSAFDIDLYQMGVDLITSLWEGIKSVMGGLSSWMKDQLSAAIPDRPAWLTRAYWSGEDDASSPSAEGGRALGGPVRAGRVYRWLEEGQEMFVPRTDGHVISNRELRALRRGPAASSGARVDVGGIVINAAAGMSPRDVAREVRRELQRLSLDRRTVLHDGGNYA